MCTAGAEAHILVHILDILAFWVFESLRLVREWVRRVYVRMLTYADVWRMTYADVWRMPYAV